MNKKRLINAGIVFAGICLLGAFVSMRIFNWLPVLHDVLAGLSAVGMTSTAVIWSLKLVGAKFGSGKPGSDGAGCVTPPTPAHNLSAEESGLADAVRSRLREKQL